MPRWRAVGFGVSVQAILSFLAALVPVIGHGLIGIGGGLAAGALGGGGTRGGAEHGLATGILGGAVVGGVMAVTVAALGGLGSPLSETVGALLPVYTDLVALGAIPALVLGTAVLVLMSLLGGLIGGALRGDRPLPRLPPEERAREREGDR